MKLIQIAIKYCKKIVSLILIMLMFATSGSSIFANNEDHKINDQQRSELIKQSEVINWNSFDGILNKKDNFIIID